MPVSNQTKDCVLQLASLMVQGTEPINLNAIVDSVFTSRPIPEHLMREQDEDSSSLLMGGEDYNAFRKALDLLTQEPELEHLTAKAIESDLWELCCELFLNKTSFVNPKTRMRRVNSYLTDIVRPHRSFEVAVILEHVRVERPITVMGVRFEHWMKEETFRWSIQDKDLADDFVDMPVAITVVQAGHKDKAIARAQRTVDQALDVLRLGIVGSSPVRISDNELMMRQGDKQLVKEEGGRLSHRWTMENRPRDTQLPPLLTDRALVHLQPIYALLARKNLSSKVKDRFFLALHWFGIAISKGNYDEKVIALCTALESLFTDKSDRRKGEIIALRAMLLQGVTTGGFTNTFPLLKLYELRSSLVHGTEVGICGDSECRVLRSNLVRLLVIQAEFMNSRPEITSFAKFISAIETTDMLHMANRWFEQFGDHARVLLEEIRSRTKTV